MVVCIVESSTVVSQVLKKLSLDQFWDRFVSLLGVLMCFNCVQRLVVPYLMEMGVGTELKLLESQRPLLYW